MNSYAVIVGLLLLEILSIFCDDFTTKPPNQHHWDYLVFTQRWPDTACSQWQEEKINNTCSLPDPPDQWTVHGIWPTKFGTKGPWNCNNTWHFNDTIIEPIKKQLEEYWINVENNTSMDSFWKHEWQKHGTCAAILPQLNNEFKYFSQGLEWIKQYNMKQILLEQYVTPSDEGYDVQIIFDAIKAVLKYNPVIQCEVDRKTKKSLLSEIQICMDKQFNLFNCNSTDYLEEDFVQTGDLITNCNKNKQVFYIDKIQPSSTTESAPTTPMEDDQLEPSPLDSLIETRKRLITIYKTIKLLIWVTI